MGWLGKIFGTTPRVLPVSVNDDNFDEVVVKSDLPVVLDFWSDTCAPCRQLEPVIMNLADEYQGQVKVCEANIAQSIKIARRFGVMATPTVLYLRNGVVVSRVSGFRGSLYHKEVIDQDLLAPVSEKKARKSA
ncbi:MAG: thioredoxin family protein [Myxococcota bacterium]